ncbi:unnamed protein product [Rhizoctonia solani]|uniref:Iminophenyl-pyruvate dimer synthase domain-containing protein n=1 Tax=Rhizoctonia solani TaxID=456999 RepID=A0A8H3CC94_9AGAM|nr:unnamed protein product [Rhizoctonia solani]
MKPNHPSPTKPPQEWSLASLHEHLATALSIELHTIPLYLFAMYCIKVEQLNDVGDRARKDLAGVLEEEMLHLALVGNILCATGGKPKLYGPNHTPIYPREIFYTPTKLHLWPPTTNAIKKFVELEKSSKPGRGNNRGPANIMSAYNTIGDFYHYLKEGIKKVHEKRKEALFDPSTFDIQFAKEEFFDDDMTQIESLDSAMKAINLIVEQGEGSEVAEQTSDAESKSHWAIFKRLQDVKIPHYDVVEDPETKDPNFIDNIKKVGAILNPSKESY